MVLRSLVIFSLALAGAWKILDPDTFALHIQNYAILPRFLVSWVAWILPPLELLGALALLTNRFQLAGWVLASALFLIFSLATGAALVRGFDISCGCFGGNTKVSWWHVLGNVLFVGVCFSRASNAYRKAITSKALRS